MKRRLRLIIGIVVSLVALWAVLRNIDPRELWLSYRDADYLYIAPALLLLFSMSGEEAKESVASITRVEKMMYLLQEETEFSGKILKLT